MFLDTVCPATRSSTLIQVREASLNAVSRTLPTLFSTGDDPKTTSSSSCDSEYFHQPPKNSFRSMLSEA